MTVGIAGLGLIGGSFAKAYKSTEGIRVLGFDKDEAIADFAQLSGAIDGTLSPETIPDCRLIIIALYPRAAISYLEEIAPFISKSAIVIDCCGVKRRVCKRGFAIAEEYGFRFVGGHPMAGTHNAGFKHSRAALLRGASMILVPPVYDEPELYGEIEALLKPVGFGRYTISTAEKHDEMIAFSSQMAHVVSNAFIKSPAAREHKGFSAGSYKDLTRVAWLNADMWSELFMENSDKLLGEIDILISALTQYREALDQGAEEGLKELLSEGSRIKFEVDGKAEK